VPDLPATAPANPPTTAWLARDPSCPAQAQAREWLAAQLDAGIGLPLQRDARGRPYLAAPFDAFDASWSHSGKHLLVALARGACVGVDVEWVQPKRRVRAIAERYFTAGEQAWLEASRDPVTAFHRLWCAKEAVLKAHGHGLAFGLDRLEFTEAATGALQLTTADPELGTATAWRLREWVPEPGYRAALAWRPRD